MADMTPQPDVGLPQNQDPTVPTNLTPPPDNSGAVPIQVNNTGVSSPVPEAAPLSVAGAAQAAVNRGEIAKGAEADIAAAQSEKAKRDAAIQDPLIAAAAQAASDAKHWQDQYAAQHDAAFGANGTLTKQLADLNSWKEDPDHWWNHKDTGGKIEAGIGLMLGGIGQGLSNWGSHGQGKAINYGIEAVDNAIKQDIDSQKDNQANKWKTYQAAAGVADNQDNYNKFKILDSQTQYVAAQRVALEKLKQSTDMEADPIAKANGVLAQNEMQKQIDDEERTWGAHNEALANAAAAATRAYQMHQLERQEKAQDTQVAQAGELEKIGVENAGKVAVIAAEAPQKEHEARTKQIAEERTKLMTELAKYGSDWTSARSNVVRQGLTDLDARQKEVDAAYIAANRPKEQSGDASKPPQSGKDLPDVKGK